MAKKKICTTNPARKLKVGKTDLSGLPTMSDEFVCAMEREIEPTEEEEKALLARQYEIAEMIRNRSPRVPVGGDGVIHVDYGRRLSDRPRLSNSQENSDEYGKTGG